MTQPRSMAPREHGAWGQLGFPIVTALALGRPTPSAVLITGACILAFLAHEPFLVVLGQRGGRALREVAGRGYLRMTVLILAACTAAVLGIFYGPPRLYETTIVPFVLALAVVGLILGEREKALFGELLVGTTLSACSLPVAFASGASMRASAGAAIVWVIGFGCATIAVRGVIARAKQGGTGLLAGAAIAVAAGGLALVLLAWALHTTWALAAAGAPTLAVSLALALQPPPPHKLRAVGWMLIVASAACAVTLVVALR